ncbi:LysR family transcriptional regulator [Ruegeria pomeroyi]|uniref:LysR family transcriptional regulator n=1 Tax=Ruegeria pomeroyi TaxID=89184 RepID=UPI001F17DF25|nr:LysR family transcriptional regulator [Ruegeria pomeroyi]MCE8510953.1 LysR family transcriptional regulator [Ruegeria pomeroyi]
MDVLKPFARAFVQIVETGSITAAADSLGMAKSTISQALRDMEEGLGIRLMTRTTRRQSLTPIGHKIYLRCAEIVRMSQAVEADVYEFLSEPCGEFTVTAPQAAITAKIAPAITSLCRSYPGLRPNLIFEDTRLDLLEHRIDVAIRVGELSDSDFKTTRIGEMVEVLCLAPSLLERHGLSTGDLSSMEAIASLPFISNVWQGKTISLAAGLEAEPTVRCNSSVAILKCVMLGLGVARLPVAMVSDALDDGRILRALTDQYEIRSPIQALHPYGNLPPLTVREFLSSLRAVL